MFYRFFGYVFLLVITACSLPHAPEVEKDDTLNIQKSSFQNLPSWDAEHFEQFDIAYQKSCTRILKRNESKAFGPDPKWGIYKNWQMPCKKYKDLSNKTPQALRTFFKTHYTPYRVTSGQNPQGLFTGYYESSLRGSRTQTGPYQTPLRARPNDLVMVQLGDFRDDLKGRRIAGRVIDGRLKPYEDHAEIINGKLPPEQDTPLIWVDDPVDAFFVQIQGSGVVTLPDGNTMRIGYAGQNGHPYYAIGRELIKRGHLTQENVSMQSIAGWLRTNPAQANEIMTTNPSYVFFRELDRDGPIGGEGVSLTPLRSLAIDRSLLPYGMPIWVDINAQTENTPNLQRLMITQDTGGAIRGAVRGDVFWGYGAQAERMAGAMKSQGQYWILLPKTLSQ